MMHKGFFKHERSSDWSSMTTEELEAERIKLTKKIEMLERKEAEESPALQDMRAEKLRAYQKKCKKNNLAAPADMVHCSSITECQLINAKRKLMEIEKVLEDKNNVSIKRRKGETAKQEKTQLAIPSLKRGGSS